jgi:hypothetical protein
MYGNTSAWVFSMLKCVCTPSGHVSSINCSISHCWTFGTYSIKAENRYIAREAFEVLIGIDNHMYRYGTLLLKSGERVNWCNLSPYSRCIV